MNTTKLLSLASALAISSVALAQAPEPKPGSAYWRDSQGQVIRDGFGGCLVSGFYTPALATEECGGPKTKPAVTLSAPKTAAATANGSLPAGPKIPEVTPAPQQVTYKASSFFDFDKSVVKPEGRARLDDLVGKIKGITLEVVIAVGHTDAIGTDAYNQRLSVRRAEAVKAYLVSKGIPANRIYTEGKGKKQPVADNRTAAGRAKNRRVEVEVVGTRPRR